MPDKDARLSADVFADGITKASTREGFGMGAVEAGRRDARVVVLCADLAESTHADLFRNEFPDRFVELGVAEQNMAAVASGMAAAGKIPFIASYAAFSPGRNYEQIRTAIALNRANVKICGMHAGVSVGPDGATHQMLEDLGMMRMLPGMTVIVPGDAEEARKAVIAAAGMDGPVYVRFGRSATPVFTTRETSFTTGKALALWESPEPRVALFSTGSLSYAALSAARFLSEGGIGSIVLHMPTVKPLDAEAVLNAARRADRAVTIEEHQAAGGFGSAITELLAERYPMPVKRIGLNDEFGQSGDPDELLAYYGLDARSIETAVRAFTNGIFET